MCAAPGELPQRTGERLAAVERRTAQRLRAVAQKDAGRAARETGAAVQRVGRRPRSSCMPAARTRVAASVRNTRRRATARHGVRSIFMRREARRGTSRALSSPQTVIDWGTSRDQSDPGVPRHQRLPRRRNSAAEYGSITLASSCWRRRLHVCPGAVAAKGRTTHAKDTRRREAKPEQGHIPGNGVVIATLSRSGRRGSPWSPWSGGQRSQSPPLPLPSSSESGSPIRVQGFSKVPLRFLGGICRVEASQFKV